MKSSARPFLPSVLTILFTLAVICILLVAGTAFLKEQRHQETRSVVEQAGLRLATASPLQIDGNGTGSVLEEWSRATRDLADFVRPSVVHVNGIQTVRTRGGPRPFSMTTGSGWIWDSAGHVITNHHVIDGTERVEVQLYDGQIRKAVVVGSDPSTDVAVLRIETGQLIPATRRSPGEPVEQGELCFAFGSPFDLRFSMSTGIISGLGRAVSLQPGGYENFIQVDASINPGNSGGPLTDHLGRVIGMNTAIATGEPVSPDQHVSSIGLAIPVDMIESVAQQVIQHGEVRKGFLGVEVMNQEQYIGAWFQRNGFPGRGVVVGSIRHDHPTRALGLRTGDIITRIDGDPVAGPDALDALMQDDEDSISMLRIWRTGWNMDGPDWLDIKWEREGKAPRDGLAVHSLNDRLAEYHRALGCSHRGVVISYTQPDMPAQLAGLRPGDLVIRVNRDPVASVRQLQSRISSIEPGESVLLELWRFDPSVGAGALDQIDVPLGQIDPEY